MLVRNEGEEHKQLLTTILQHGGGTGLSFDDPDAPTPVTHIVTTDTNKELRDQIKEAKQREWLC